MKIYITCEPFSTPKTGDYDYVYQLSRLIPDAELLKTDNNEMRDLYLDTLYDGKKDNYKSFMKKYNKLYNNKKRQLLVKTYIDKILDNSDNKKILWLNLRPPESGFLFFPDDLERLKRNGIKILITVHEFYINSYRKYNKIITINLLKYADHVIFFNKIDANEAVKMGMKNNFSFTKQLRTCYIDTISPLKRDNNILFFGIIRPNKGLENIIKLVKLLYKYNKKYDNKIDVKNVFVMGKIEVDNPLIKNWLKCISDNYKDIVDNNLNVKYPYDDILKIYKNPSDADIKNITNKCRYMYKSDGKGFANNSSSLINLLYMGGLLFTKWSQFTPKYLIDKNSEYYGSVMFQKKQDNNILNDKIPGPVDVLYNIKTMTDNKYADHINKVKLLLNNEYNPDKIINNLVNVLNKL